MALPTLRLMHAVPQCYNFLTTLPALHLEHTNYTAMLITSHVAPRFSRRSVLPDTARDQFPTSTVLQFSCLGST